MVSDHLLVRATTNPGESFLDRMIHLVEGAKRQKTPNEMALTVLLAILTLIFVIVVAAMAPVAVNLQAQINIADLIALLVAPTPTTIGALLSAIGIAGIDRTFRFNVLATSGKAVEAAGDVHTLLLDKTGTITIGNRQATEFIPLAGTSADALVQAAYLASAFDTTPEGRSVIVFAEKLGAKRDSLLVAPAPRFLGGDAHERRRSARRTRDPKRSRQRRSPCGRSLWRHGAARPQGHGRAGGQREQRRSQFPSMTGSLA